jgi:transposase-like protein
MKPRKNKGGSIAVYEESLKIAMARDYLTGSLSYTQVAEKYNIAGTGDTVRWFVKWYKKRYGQDLAQTNSSVASVEERTTQEPEKNTPDLDKQLSEANLRIAALEMMIVVAEEDFGIEIRKKPGTKQ